MGINKKAEIEKALKEVKVSKNIFVKASKEIADICNKKPCDVGVGLDIYCTEKSMNYNDYAKERKEFLEFVRICTLNKMIEVIKDADK